MGGDKFQRFIEFAISIVKRPVMYSVYRVEDFQLILYGYLSGLKDNESTDFMSEFREFVDKDFEIEGNYFWTSLIRFHAGNDQDSIKLFSKLFYSFLESKGIAAHL